MALVSVHMCRPNKFLRRDQIDQAALAFSFCTFAPSYIRKMGERKVLNKYIPADFDPSLLPRIKRDWNKLIEVSILHRSSECMNCDTEWTIIGSNDASLLHAM